MKTQKKELGSARCNAVSFDYRGSLDVDERLDSVTGPAFAEALAGALLMVIPTPVTWGIGTAILSNTGFTMWQHWKDERDRLVEANRFDQEGIAMDQESSFVEHDRGHYERQTDSEIR
ncbi:hypothetical protein [Simkania sp.]|uniref:hypothetical protein n=1 Tax=Simkania sp. TaxID=34094 RepID=UPI003B52B038